MEIRFRDTHADRIKTDLGRYPGARKEARRPGHPRARSPSQRPSARAHRAKANLPAPKAARLLYPTAGMLPAAHLLLIGIGAGETSGDTWRKTGARARKEAAAIGANEFALLFAPEKDPESAAGAIVEGALLASYQFNKYRSNCKPADGS